MEGSGGSSGASESDVSTVPLCGGLDSVGGASRHATTSQRDAQQLGLLLKDAVEVSDVVALAFCSAGVKLALGSSLESSGCRAASLMWFFKLRYDALYGPD